MKTIADKETPKKLCGDGFCNEIEKQNPSLCLNDCLEKTSALPTDLLIENSPFGFHL